MTNGRPSKKGQLAIQRKLRPYFESGVFASVASEKTGINIKTVCKYFTSWTERVRESEEGDFFERQRKDRIRIIISFDKQILDAYDHLEDINEEIARLKKKGMEIPNYLFSLRLATMRYISSLNEKRGSFAMQPIMDEALEKKIAGIIAKHDNSG